jgi:hypothetical protein
MSPRRGLHRAFERDLVVRVVGSACTAPIRRHRLIEIAGAHRRLALPEGQPAAQPPETRVMTSRRPSVLSRFVTALLCIRSRQTSIGHVVVLTAR